MQAKFLLWATLILTATVSVSYLASGPSSKLEKDSELDLTCGFSDDFNKFLKENGIISYS